jgi:uncharacterized damage-inducible protein DinB
MNLVDHFRHMARNNAWSNYRLHRACERLRPGEFEAKGVSFFPSLQRTLNHILIVDWYYLDALEAGGRGLSVVERDVPCPTLAELAPAQKAADERLIAYCDALTSEGIEHAVTLERGSRVAPTETVAAVLAHLFMHQIHHRGQAHAMLAGTSIPPPQLDEYLLRDDARLRENDMRALGWTDWALSRATAR